VPVCSINSLFTLHYITLFTFTLFTLCEISGQVVLGTRNSLLGNNCSITLLMLTLLLISQDFNRGFRISPCSHYT